MNRKMEILTLFFVIMACLVCAALAVAALGFRQTTFEQAVAAQSSSIRTSKTTGNMSPRTGQKAKTKTEDSRTVLGNC